MPAKDPLYEEIEDLFAKARPLGKKELDDFAKRTRAILDEPSFKADVLKDQFIHNIYEALEEEGLSQSAFASRLGKSRQYLSKILKEDRRINYSLDTLVEVMHHLGRRVDIYYPRISEETVVIHCLRHDPVRRSSMESAKPAAALAKDFKRDRQPAELEIQNEHLAA